MNRRSFIGNIIAAGIAPLILPGIGRNWKYKKSGDLYVPNPDYVNAEYEVILIGLDNKEYNFGPIPKLNLSEIDSDMINWVRQAKYEHSRQAS